MEREEALHELRCFIGQLTEGCQEALKTLIPELKESRDEQIRKAIIKSLDLPFMEAKIEGTDITYEEAVAWLEKQKEPIPIPDKFSGLKSLMLQYLQSAANRKDDAEIESDTDLWGRKILDYVWKYDEKQKYHFRDDTKMVEQMLEWAKEKYEEYDRRIAGFPDDGAYWGQRNAFRQIIDKLNSI